MRLFPLYRWDCFGLPLSGILAMTLWGAFYRRIVEYPANGGGFGHSEELNLLAVVKTRINAAKNKNRRLQPSCSLSVGIYVLASKTWSYSAFRHCYYVVWSDSSTICLSPRILWGGFVVTVWHSRPFNDTVWYSDLLLWDKQGNIMLHCACLPPAGILIHQDKAISPISVHK